jgi:hypothetical protein
LLVEIHIGASALDIWRGARGHWHAAALAGRFGAVGRLAGLHRSLYFGAFRDRICAGSARALRGAARELRGRDDPALRTDRRAPCRFSRRVRQTSPSGPIGNMAATLVAVLMITAGIFMLHAQHGGAPMLLLMTQRCMTGAKLAMAAPQFCSRGVRGTVEQRRCASLPAVDIAPRSPAFYTEGATLMDATH